MKKITALLLLWSLSMPGLVAAEEVSIKLFLAPGQKVLMPTLPMNNVEVEVYRVGQVDRLEKRLSRKLPVSEAQAKEQLGKILKKSPISREIAKAYQAEYLANYYELKKMPAAIVNQRYIVYGSTDIQQIVEHVK